MNRPYFSIVTPSYNAGEKLNQTLDSILSQTFGDYEIIVKDAGSTDGSLETMRTDSRIRLIRSKDKGIYDGMNEAIALASGEYLYFLNCGDVLHNEMVFSSVVRAMEQYYEDKEKAIKQEQEKGPSAAERSSEGCIFYGDVVEKATGQHVAANPNMTHLAMYRNLPCHQACFYSRNLFAERGFDTQYKIRADYEHFLWCVMKEGAITKALPLIIADYEGGGFSETKENRACSKEEHERIAEEYFTKEECRYFHWYMILTLQPLREKLAHSRATAGIYNGIKNRLYGRKT